ncbi:hypothetical protein [Rhizobium sp. MHM7A]|uniref:hypothetical protein n=1 Tax=Rhizobium sp. MHM7A TaxID=2583233 RepID=UPI001105B71A|nr:hypothetical protein [Rhizobium sp. MHM7A]TLX12107.1 hypothetical protein FFR93_16185 [Rhizobium sp. MHM7A]
MRNFFEIRRLQQYSAEEYADGRERRDGPHAVYLRDYIEFSFSYGAKLAAQARAAMNVTDADQIYS